MKLLGKILHSVRILWFFLHFHNFFFRTEYDAYRSDLEYYTSAPKTDVNLAKKNETEDTFNRQKLEFERLRSDVQIKLKFLDENRVSFSTTRRSDWKLLKVNGYRTETVHFWPMLKKPKCVWEAVDFFFYFWKFV